MNARVLAHTKPAAKSVIPPARSNLLQRKCACGGTPGLSGECAECRKKKLRLQTKLLINEPGDIYEQEADRIADQVMAAFSSPAVSGTPPRIQRFSGYSNGRMDGAPTSVDQALASPGRLLEPTLRQDMEQRFGYDFSGVRVHTDAAAEQSARDIGAEAYTVGRDVVFGAGQYAPVTMAGKKLIAHELAHVTQQAQNALPRALEGRAWLQRSPRSRRGGNPRKKEGTRIINSKTARLVMEWILGIISKVDRTDPAKWRTEDKSLSEYRDLLSLWFKLANGKLEGEEFASAFERADAETTPIFQASLRGTPPSWQDIVSDRWYPNFFELQKRAESEKHIAKLVETTTSFHWDPTPVSIDEFLRVASAQNSRSPVLQRGSGIKVGRAVAGFTYYASQHEPRLVLWAGPEGVFFLLDDQIYKQSVAGFSDDIVLGAIIKAAQDVEPFVNLVTAVVDMAISFTPVGWVYDLTTAAKEAADGNWRAAALGILPVLPVGKLAKATKIGRAAFRGGAKGLAFIKNAVAGAATFVGKGIGKVGGKLRRGLWIVAEGAGEAGGKKAYYFLDEAEDVWRAVPKEEAEAFIKCTNPCNLTKMGKAESQFTTEEIQQHVLEETGTKVPAGERTLEEIGVSKKVLQAARAKHHLFVQQLRKWFKGKGLDIDKYTLKLAADEHRLIHNEYRWNEIWKDFMKANPKASKRQLFKQMREMLKEYGLEGLPIVPYK